MMAVGDGLRMFQMFSVHKDPDMFITVSPTSSSIISNFI